MEGNEPSSNAPINFSSIHNSLELQNAMRSLRDSNPSDILSDSQASTPKADPETKRVDDKELESLLKACKAFVLAIYH